MQISAFFLKVVIFYIEKSFCYPIFYVFKYKLRKNGKIKYY